MEIPKDQILQLLRSQGQDDQASHAGSELPDKLAFGMEDILAASLRGPSSGVLE